MNVDKLGAADNRVHHLSISLNAEYLFKRRAQRFAVKRFCFSIASLFKKFLTSLFSLSSLRTSATFAPLRLVFLSRYIVWLWLKASRSLRFQYLKPYLLPLREYWVAAQGCSKFISVYRRQISKVTGTETQKLCSLKFFL